MGTRRNIGGLCGPGAIGRIVRGPGGWVAGCWRYSIRIEGCYWHAATFRAWSECRPMQEGNGVSTCRLGSVSSDEPGRNRGQTDSRRDSTGWVSDRGRNATQRSRRWTGAFRRLPLRHLSPCSHRVWQSRRERRSVANVSQADQPATGSKPPFEERNESVNGALAGWDASELAHQKKAFPRSGWAVLSSDSVG